jgi:hypothetical protein
VHARRSCGRSAGTISNLAGSRVGFGIRPDFGVTFRRAVTMALFGALFLFVTACSGDDSADDAEDDSGDENSSEASAGDGQDDRDDYVAAFTDTFDNPYATPEDRQCMGEATVDTLGLETLRATGTPDQVREAHGQLQEFGMPLEETTAGALVDALDACADMRTLVFGDEEVLPPEVRSCIESRVPDDLFRRFMISTYTSANGQSDDSAVQAEVNNHYNECSAQADS